MGQIRPGQIYESCQPSPGMPGEHHIRIKVIGEPGTMTGMYGFGKVDVATLTEDGRMVRPRALEVNQLHATNTAKTGQPRRTGYRLVEDAA